jgi:Transposase
VTWEEGIWAAWLYDLLKPQVHEVLVCNPRRNALLKEGSKNDKVDARKLSELFHAGMLRPVYHGENGVRTLRELGRTYETISQDLNRVMNRVKALYRGWGIACAGTQVYAPRYREEWSGENYHRCLPLRLPARRSDFEVRFLELCRGIGRTKTQSNGVPENLR